MKRIFYFLLIISSTPLISQDILPLRERAVLIEKIQPVAKKIMFGEACSSVPIFKRNK